MMLKKSLTLLLALVLVSVMATAVLAFKGPITAVDGAVLTMTVDGQVPPWVEKGALAKTLGGLAKIKAVDGQELQIKVKKSKAKKLKVGEVIEVKPKSVDPSQMLQGC